MTNRQLGKPFRFYCITDDPQSILDAAETAPEKPKAALQSVSGKTGAPEQDALKTAPHVSSAEGIQILPMPKALVDCPDDWKKLALFHPDLAITGQVLYLDLGVVLLDKIDMFFQYPSQFRMVENMHARSSGIGDSSIMGFSVGAHTKVFDLFAQDPEAAIQKHKRVEAFLPKALGHGRVQYWPGGWCKDFQRDCLSKWFRFRRTPFPYAAKALVFKADLQPHQAIEGVCQGMFPPRMRPVRWLKNYWGDAPQGLPPALRSVG